jgi:hypothetical protein
MKVFGKIQKASYGMGGYDGVMFGLSLTFSLADGCGVQDFKGNWASYPERAKYTLEQWQEAHLEAALFLCNLLREAKKREVSELTGTPIEAEIENNTLKSWRVLTEVL